MNTVHPIYGSGQFRISQIWFNCDLRSKVGYRFPLGVIADIRIGPVYGLGLTVRTSIASDEEAIVGELIRDSIRQPFELLKADFDRVLHASDSEREFLALCSEVPSSIEFTKANTEKVDVPRNLRAQVDLKGKFGVWIDSEFPRRVTDNFWSMINGFYPDDCNENATLMELKRAA